MKHLYFCLALLATAGVKAQIPNAGFETWTSMGAYTVPDGWDNLNANTEPMSVYTCEEGTPGSPGASYLELTSRTAGGMGVVPGIAVCGTLDHTTFQPTGGFAFDQRPASLTGKWQYMASGADQGFISVTLTKWNTISNTRETVASALRHLTGMAMSWANFTINLNYASGDAPDSATIVLSASGLTPVNYSYLSVDNLAFSGTVTGINERSAAATFTLFPNPATEQFAVRLDNTLQGNIDLQMIDAAGRVVRQQSIRGAKAGQNIGFSTAGLGAGYYVVKTTSEKGVYAQRLVIN